MFQNACFFKPKDWPKMPQEPPKLSQSCPKTSPKPFPNPSKTHRRMHWKKAEFLEAFFTSFVSIFTSKSTDLFNDFRCLLASRNFIDFWYPFAFPIHYFSTNFLSLRPSYAKNDFLWKYVFSQDKSQILRFRAFIRTANSTKKHQKLHIKIPSKIHVCWGCPLNQKSNKIFAKIDACKSVP